MKRIIIITSSAVLVCAAAIYLKYAVPSYNTRIYSPVFTAAKNVPEPTPDISPAEGYVLVKQDAVFKRSAPDSYDTEIIGYGGNERADGSYTLVYSSNGKEFKITNPKNIEEYKENVQATEIPAMEGLPELKNSLSEYISGIDGDWGVYIKRMDTNEYISLNEKQYSGASLIKLFTMAAVYNEIAAGSITKNDEISEELNLMITESSNIDCNALTAALGGGDTVKGFEVENCHTNSIGCINTVHQSELVDGTGETIFVGYNRTSPADCGLILENIYKRKLVNAESSDEMLDLLKRQTRTWKIPEGLPDGTVTANKTGENDNVEADAAIVYSPACDYVICVIGNGDISGAGVENIRVISKMAYDYLN